MRPAGSSDRKRVSFWWTMGVNQSHQGVKTAQAIINLALLTGNIGRPGTGANSITGQCNAMGSRLFSNTTNLLGGHDFTNPAHRAEGRRAARHPRGAHPHAPELGLRPHHRRHRRGQDPRPLGHRHQPGPFLDRPGPSSARPSSKLDFLVVQDMYHSTETAQLADLLLPAAGWGEKEGTFINSERRIGLIKKVRRAPGPGPFRLSHLQAGRPLLRLRRLFAEWESPEAVFQILKRLSAGLPCDITGIADYRRARRGRRHPVALPGGRRRREPASGGSSPTAGSTTRTAAPGSSSRSPRPLPEPPGGEFPFQLLTGRGSAAQWHTQTRTAKSDVLRKLYPRDPYVEINPADAKALGLRAGQWAVVESRRGSGPRAGVRHPDRPAGQLFLPMHDESHQPADRRRLRSGVATAGLQGLRGAGPADRADGEVSRPPVDRSTTQRPPWRGPLQ